MGTTWAAFFLLPGIHDTASGRRAPNTFTHIMPFPERFHVTSSIGACSLAISD